MNDTIAAISTPSGTGAIAVTRLSGPESFRIASKIFTPAGGEKPFEVTTARGLRHGWIHDGNRRIDEVVISHFRGPGSYTGQDMIEISCHGSSYIQQEILKLLILSGARLARPGEFTERAFLNGKMDLAQAEAVADLIAASGAAAHRLALEQIRGGFSTELAIIRGELLNFVSLIELELDFSEEDVEFADRTRLKVLVDSIIGRVSALIESFDLGNAIKSGVPVTIAGETNVGKSTLLNALLKEEKAIVSEIAGTTRDSIEDCIHLGGIEFRFIDTAGIRETDDRIENLGIERSFRQIEKARIILLVTDATSEPGHALRNAIRITERLRNEQHLLVLANKADIDPAGSEQFLQTIIRGIGNRAACLRISAKNSEGVKEIEAELLRLVHAGSAEDSGVVVTNVRHYEALARAREALYRTLTGLDTGISSDFLSQDIREAMHYLGEITGQISNDEVLGNIFRNFCIGK